MAVTEAQTTRPIPASYKDAPEAYYPVLDCLYRAVRTKNTEELWEGAGILDAPHFAFEDEMFYLDMLGYAVKDINGDGVPELLLLYRESFWNPAVPILLSLYTLHEGRAVRLDSYHNARLAHITEDGTVYVAGRSSAVTTSLESYSLEAGAAELTQLTEYTRDFSGSKNVYFEGESGGKRKTLSADEYNVMWEKYFHPAKQTEIEFVGFFARLHG